MSDKETRTLEHPSDDKKASNADGADATITTAETTPTPLLLTRRRDKRRHLSGAAACLDLRNPLQVLELAVRLDESRQDEALLMEPLEKGKVHDHKEFLQALEFLERRTKPPSTLDQKAPMQSSSSAATASTTPTLNSSTLSSENSNSSTRILDDFREVVLRIWGNPSVRDTAEYPDHALTPIILSGLISTVQEQQENKIPTSTTTPVAANAKSNTPTTTTTTTTNPILKSMDPVGELFLTCQTMRRAAIRRVRNRHIRLRIQRNILPAASFCLLLLLYVQSIRESIYTLTVLHFMDPHTSCRAMFSGTHHHHHYEDACHLAEAHLWTTFQDYLLLDSCRNTGDECLLRKFGRGPLALQALFSRQLVPIEDVLDDTTTATPRELFHLGQITKSQSPLIESKKRPYGYLGLSAAHQTIELSDSRDLKEWRILDAGCGVGAALWYLMPENRTNFYYYGISLSQAEVHFARSIVQRHGLGHEDNILFEQRNYDEALPPNSYNTIIAVESLAYSPDLSNTIGNLVTALQPGGTMVIADEFDLTLEPDSSLGAARKAPSFMSYIHYSSFMEMHGCKVTYFREYGLEFHFEGYHRWSHRESPWDWIFYPWLPGGNSRLYQLRRDQEWLHQSFRQKKDDSLEGRTTYSLIVCVKTEAYESKV